MQLLFVPNSFKESLPTIEGSITALYQEGSSRIFSSQNGPMPLKEYRANTVRLLEKTSQTLFAYYQNIQTL